MPIRISELLLAGTLLVVSAPTAEAAVIASPTSPAGLLMTALLALALGWRLAARRGRTQ